jgi:very-short-patch-repair endonuclease
MTLADDIHDHDGLAATHELLRIGWTSRQLSRAVAIGEIVRVRQGWYTVPGTAEPAQQAARVGGRLTCISGARMHGLAVRDRELLHVAVAPHASRLRSKTDKSRRLARTVSAGVAVHWSDGRRRGTRFSQSVLDCLMEMALCQPAEATVAAADSAIRARLVRRQSWRRSCATLPGRLAALLMTADGTCESITESLCLFRLRGLGIEPRPQVRIPGVGRVDFVVGERLVVEVDGRAYHSDPEQFETDRRRDARLSARGYRVLRFSYRQVTSQWSEVKASVLAAIARGDHLP